MKKFLIALIVLLTSTSCSNEDAPELLDENFKLERENQSKFVSKEKASSVGAIFMKKQNTISGARSNSLKSSTIKGEDQEIKSVETIYLKDGTSPSMYLIKYHGGWIYNH